MYCCKNTARRARECMRENRLKKHTNEISELMQNEDLSVNDSNIMEYDATDNTYNNTTASTVCVISSLLDETLDEIESSFGDVNGEELEVESFDCSKQVYYYCWQCLSHLNTPEQAICTDGCLFNNKRRPFMNVIELATNNVKDEIFSTAKRYINLINEYYIRSKDILSCDVINGSLYERLGNTSQRQLTIILHTDGAPVTKIGGKSLWPVQATILEIPPPIRDHISAVMVFAAWLSGSHSSRELLWNSIVEQIHNLYNNGIIIKLHDNTKIKFNIRIQLITFDLPALAFNCNIVQLNGYDACPFCKIHGYSIGKQIFDVYSQTPSSDKTDHDYIQLSMPNRPRLRSSSIKGSIPLTKIMLFPSQIAVDYMHLVCSGHFKTLITY
ncbi:unnamed protein product [Rotaria sp. Silwood1]|nr:unnamed protein product [Rotaria sp. Silwood1]